MALCEVGGDGMAILRLNEVLLFGYNGGLAISDSDLSSQLGGTSFCSLLCGLSTASC